MRNPYVSYKNQFAQPHSALHTLSHSEPTTSANLPDMGHSIVCCSICGCPFQDISCESTEGTFDEGTLLADQTKVSGAHSIGFELWLILLVARPVSSNWQG